MQMMGRRTHCPDEILAAPPATQLNSDSARGRGSGDDFDYDNTDNFCSHQEEKTDCGEGEGFSECWPRIDIPVVTDDDTVARPSDVDETNWAETSGAAAMTVSRAVDDISSSSSLEDFDCHDDDDDFGEGKDGESKCYAHEDDDEHDTFVQLLNLPPSVTTGGHLGPVGGIKRVSSCYFSIASNISDGAASGGGDFDLSQLHDAPVATSGSSHAVGSRSSSQPMPPGNASSADVRPQLDFCSAVVAHHDVLTNVFSFLDAHAFAAFSETARRPNFECFYFLELQLQRALLGGLHRREDGEVVSYKDANMAHITGAGFVSRLASMDVTAARAIVQKYLNSNSSIDSMPLSHSHAYLRHVIQQRGGAPRQFHLQPPHVHLPQVQMPEKSAKNLAIIFTVLGAASYMHGGGEVSEVMMSDSTAAMRDALLKMGIAGGLFRAAAIKAGVTGADRIETSNDTNDDDVGGKTCDQSHDENDHERSEIISSQESGSGENEADAVGAVQDSTAGEGGRTNHNRRKHRGQRSHSVQPHAEAMPASNSRDAAANNAVHNCCHLVSKSSNVNSRDGLATKNDKDPEVVAYAMDHPFSSNPYEHLNLASESGRSSHTSLFNTDALSSVPSFGSTLSTDRHKAPSGCIGAYARAVKEAVATVTRLTKERRRAKSDALSDDEKLRLGIRFIDACSSDDKLPIVKDMLQKQGRIDVDRFFIGSDGTETCGLHAAAFNGAEKVLSYLCGGIDEQDPEGDGGLCDVNVRDPNGWTALHFAAGTNNVALVKTLAKHGAKLKVEAGNGYTPFHWAERLSNEEVARELERLGADNRFVVGWMFGSGGSTNNGGRMPLVSFLTNRFFAFAV